jgi:hypothetical protein
VARVNEAQFQAQVVQLAELYGWAYLHIRPARIRDRHLTPVAGALGPGWPDLVLVRERVVCSGRDVAILDPYVMAHQTGQPHDMSACRVCRVQGGETEA